MFDQEKLGHHACAAEIARLKESIDRGAAERTTMSERLEALQSELEAERVGVMARRQDTLKIG